MSQTPWTPPYIAQPTRPDPPLRQLRNATRLGARNWPDTIYAQGVTPLLGKRIQLVTDTDILHDVMVARPDDFEQARTTLTILRTVWGNGLAAATGQSWRWQRKAIAPVFAPKSVESVVPLAQQYAATLGAQLFADDGRVDVTKSVADAITNVVFEAFVGGKETGAAQAQFAQAGAVLSAEIGRINLADVFQLPGFMRPLFGKTGRRPGRHLNRIVADVLAHEGPPQPWSLRAQLRDAKDPETGAAMTDALVRDNIVGSLAAGRETTALALSWTLWCLSHQPVVARALRDQIGAAGLADDIDPTALARIPLARQVLNEVMRLFPPAPVTARQVRNDVTIKGHTFAKGSLVIIPVYGLHRHPDFWENPHVFDPARFAPDRFDFRTARYRFMPFGGGPRICVGMAFSMIELETMLVTILRDYSLLAVGQADEIVLEMGATLRSRDGLRVKLVADPV